MVQKVLKEDLEDGLRFDKQGRMLYHPDFHFNNGKRYTEEELEYLCRFFDFDDIRTISFALGRPETSLATQVSMLKKQGKFSYYKRLNKHCVSRR
ncbi:hypothetical protein SAMN05444673_2545 [Bacillus sp. OV166]|uniref:DNA-entry nuclease n=1 Tax=Bacillus sp. OV166 TaxID=1882763 RepID=UPI000A2AB50E|nr:DNA-entry nuclease [Bacillus sp. OV166]SMQ75788.1 hypothetical protein SAMN05444673_2545 [Bacillus sp. OV166]